jgi:hypothetical protein
MRVPQKERKSNKNLRDCCCCKSERPCIEAGRQADEHRQDVERAQKLLAEIEEGPVGIEKRARLFALSRSISGQMSHLLADYVEFIDERTTPAVWEVANRSGLEYLMRAKLQAIREFHALQRKVETLLDDLECGDDRRLEAFSEEQRRYASARIVGYPPVGAPPKFPIEQAPAAPAA